MARGSSIGNPMPYILDYKEEGFNATQALSDFRNEQGMSITTQTWYRAWGQAEAALANESNVGRLDYNRTPIHTDFVDWSAGSRPAYAHQTMVTVVEPSTGISRNIPHTVIADEPLSPFQAAQQAMDEVQGLSSGTDYSMQAIGAVVTNLFYMTGES